MRKDDLMYNYQS